VLRGRQHPHRLPQRRLLLSKSQRLL
jgi:hypothetical protein